MPFRPQPADALYAPPRYPAPDWGKDGLTVRVFVPEDNTVGWLVRQGDAIAWLSAVGPNAFGYGVRRIVDDVFAAGALAGATADATWDRALSVTLHEMPVERPLSEITALL